RSHAKSSRWGGRRLGAGAGDDDQRRQQSGIIPAVGEKVDPAQQENSNDNPSLTRPGAGPRRFTVSYLTEGSTAIRASGSLRSGGNRYDRGASCCFQRP